MPRKLTDRENNDLINSRDDARKKAQDYGVTEKVSRIFEQKRRGLPRLTGQPDFQPRREAATALANMYEQEAENLDIRRQPDSIQQYRHEKEQGDPNAVRLSFEEWKKL
jgi:hypothetical protein